MATDFTTNTTSTKGGFKPSSVDTPIDVRTRIETLSDIETIPLPYVGMVFYVRETGKRYEVLSLKDKKSGMSTTKDAMVDEYREMLVSYNDLLDKPKIPSIGHLATKEEVNTVRDLIPSIDGLASEEYVNTQIANIEHPQYDDSELRQMIEAIEIPEVPSIEGLATEEFVKEQIEAIEHPVYDDSELRQMINSIEHPQYDDSELRDIIADKADKSEVPSIDGLASEEYVQQQIASIEHPQYDDSELRGMIEAIEVPSIEGLATEDYVAELIEAIEIPEVPSTDHLATKEELGDGLDTKVDKVEGKSLVDNNEITRLAGIFNANYQFKVKMIEFGLEPTVEVTGEYPNLIVTFGIPHCIPIEEKIWYGWIPYDETGAAGFCTPEEIHEGLDKRIIQFGINNGSLIEAKPGEVEYSLSAPDNAWICTIVPVKSGLKGYIDDGVGNKIPFTEMDTASGFACDDLEITNTIDFVKYKVSGLYVVTAGAETIIYIEK